MDKLDKKLNRLTKYMSNTKWYKLFETLQKSNVIYARFKFFHRDEEYEFPVDGFEKTGYGDCNAFGPFDYKDIQWVRFVGRPENNITADGMEKIINSLGKFEYEKNENSIKIYGYK